MKHKSRCGEINIKYTFKVNNNIMDNEIQDLIEDVASYIKIQYLEAIKNHVRKDSPLNNITVDVNYQGDYYNILFNVADYWEYFENGRRPGKMPPPRIIENWIKVKRIIPKPINGKIPTTKQLAFVISRHIGENGVKGKHIFEKVLFSPKVDNKIKIMKENIANSVLNKILDEFRDNIKITNK